MVKLNFAVIGNPVNHSMSPDIHNYFASQFELKNFSYRKILSTKNNLKKTINSFFIDNGLGLNITIPFKTDAYELCDTLDETAKQCGSVNTLKYESNKIIGYNTDGLGLVDDLKRKNINVNNSNILILGAGGSAMSITSVLIKQSNNSKISILNRTKSNADKMIAFFNTNNLKLHNPGDSYDLIINTTPISMSNHKIIIPNNILKKSSICYDLFYSIKKTHFQKWACDHNIETCYDGLGMLIEQARRSFIIWNKVTPNTENLESKLRII